MATTKISWTEMSWNPITGCTKISAGCINCYAESIANRFWKDRKFTDIKFHPKRLEQPLHWKKPCMIFVNSMSDLFHEKISFKDITKIYLTMQEASQHTYQILTKRPERILEYMESYADENGNWQKHFSDYIGHIWHGITMENQPTYNERSKYLKEIPGIKFVSFEPLLEDIIVSSNLDYANWAIIGCESGANKRECKIEWVENLVAQLKSKNIKIFVKQLNINGKVEKDINNFPKHLQIREYPERK